MKNKALCAALMAAIGGVGCSGPAVDVTEFEGYGAGQPGRGLVHGGQMFLELIHSPTGDIGMLHSWARDFPDSQPDVKDTLPIPPIPSGTCMNISTPVFPRPPLEGSQFLDLGPEFSVSNGTVTHTAPLKNMQFVDNLQYGIPLGYQLNPFDATTIQHDTTYTVSFNGPGGSSDTLEPNTFHFSPKYEIYNPPVGKMPLTFTRGQPIDMSWEPVNQDAGGTEHTPERTFAFVIFLSMPSPTAPGQFKVFCPLNDGQGHDSFQVPAEVVDSLPANGMMVTGQQTHVMAKFNDKRFDLITIECNRSPFSFAQ